MFYDKFVRLCAENGEKPSVVAQKIGLNKSASTAWKRGSEPTDATKERVSAFFSVPVSYFDEENKKSPETEVSELDSDSIKILELIHQLTPENSVRAIAYIQGLVDTQ